MVDNTIRDPIANGAGCRFKALFKVNKVSVVFLVLINWKGPIKYFTYFFLQYLPSLLSITISIGFHD